MYAGSRTPAPASGYISAATMHLYEDDDKPFPLLSDATTVCRRQKAQMLGKKGSVASLGGRGKTGTTTGPTGNSVQGRSSMGSLRSTKSFSGGLGMPLEPKEVSAKGMCLREQEQHAARLHRENWALKLDVTLMKESRDQLSKTNAGLQESVDRLTMEARSVKRDLETVREDLKKREEELGEAYNKIEKLKESVGTLRGLLMSGLRRDPIFKTQPVATPEFPVWTGRRSPSIDSDSELSESEISSSDSESDSDIESEVEIESDDESIVSSAGSYDSNWQKGSGSRSLFSISEASSSASLRSRISSPTSPSPPPHNHYKYFPVTSERLQKTTSYARSRASTIASVSSHGGKKHSQHIETTYDSHNNNYSAPASPRRILKFNRNQEADDSSDGYSSDEDGIFDDNESYYQNDYVRTPLTLSPEPQQQHSHYPELYSPYGSSIGMGERVKKTGSMPTSARQNRGRAMSNASSSSLMSGKNMVTKSLNEFLAERVMGLSAPIGGLVRETRIPAPVGLKDKALQRKHMSPIGQLAYQRETLERRRMREAAAAGAAGQQF